MEPPSPEDEVSGLTRGYARGRARDEAIRESLEPLDEGERPGAVTAAISVATVLGVVNLVLFAAGVDIKGKHPSVVGVLVFAALMAAVAIGMWRGRYPAVLAFQALLGITIVIAALSLLVASNLAAVGLCAAIVGLGGWLFWKLIRVMARLQMPERPTDH